MGAAPELVTVDGASTVGVMIHKPEHPKVDKFVSNPQVVPFRSTGPSPYGVPSMEAVIGSAVAEEWGANGGARGTDHAGTPGARESVRCSVRPGPDMVESVAVGLHGGLSPGRPSALTRV